MDCSAYSSQIAWLGQINSEFHISSSRIFLLYGRKKVPLDEYQAPGRVQSADLMKFVQMVQFWGCVQAGGSREAQGDQE